MSEINVLTHSIFELKEFFMRMEDLVFHQGTIIDRIDFNIQNTFDTIQMGN